VTARPALGVAFPLDAPLEQIVTLAGVAEDLGYDHVWATDDRLQRDVFITLAAIAVATSRVRLGPGVTNPFSRHPALIAAAIATLDELSGGRAALGLGAGGTNHRALGVRREAPVSALAETVDLIRGLLDGREITFEGRVVHTVGARLDFSPLRRHVPIYIGARGPKMLELGGAVADGVIVGNIASPAGWRYATARIEAGAVRAGRGAQALELAAWVYCAIDDDAEAALDAIRPKVATSLATSRPILDELGVEPPLAYQRRMEAHGWSLEQDAVADAGRELPPEILRYFGLAGTSADCASSLRELLREFPQISQVSVVPAATTSADIDAVLRRFATEVMPAAVRIEAPATA
jgi:5,10-methylenetetrahydromethanopterin reductase